MFITLNRISVGQVGVSPGKISMTTDQELATIVSSGFLKQGNGGIQFSPLDIIEAIYDVDPTSLVGIFGIFTVGLNGNVITLTEWTNAGDVLLPVVSGNIPNFNGTTGQIQDGGLASNKILTSAITNPDVSIDLVSFDVPATSTSLASGGHVTLYPSSGSKRYIIRALWSNSGGSNFSGGGNRLATISDGTTAYSVIPAASLQTLANTAWGATGLPFPASASLMLMTAAGASLTIAYSGGTTDYTSGAVTISGLLQRVA
jgi:hypothetical protein